jgi:hypothetical protein
MKKITIMAVSLAALLALTGCGSKNVALGDINLDVKNYPPATGNSQFAFATAYPRVTVNAQVSRYLDYSIIKRLKYDVDALNCNLINQIDKIILSKGFSITGRFKTRDDMTFTEKRNTTALFYPEIVWTIREDTITTTTTAPFLGNQVSADGSLVGNVLININVLEPLSNEKVWVKTIKLDDVKIPTSYSLARTANPSSFSSHSVPVDLQPLANSIDQMTVKLYDEVQKLVERQVSREEFELLDADIKQLKELKRY